VHSLVELRSTKKRDVCKQKKWREEFSRGERSVFPREKKTRSDVSSIGANKKGNSFFLPAKGSD
jgi:hypothetical protein